MSTRILSLIALSSLLAGCPSSGGGKGGGNGASSGAACTGGKVDLSKVSGDWVATAPLDDRDGKVPGDQYRVRFVSAPGADGKFKALMAWRMDTRPFNGELTTNALGQKIRLEEDLPAEVIAQLRAQNNQDPNIPMRAVLEITPAEKDCALDVNDNFQSFMGEKTIEKTAMGALKLTAYKGSAPMSFVRCDAPKTIYFNGKAENEQGLPRVNVAADQAITIRSSAAASPPLPAAIAESAEIDPRRSCLSLSVSWAAAIVGSSTHTIQAAIRMRRIISPARWKSRRRACAAWTAPGRRGPSCRPSVPP